MTEIAVGSLVRVRDPNGYIAAVRTKVDRGRVGTVQKIYTPAGRRDPAARVVFHARCKGSPTFKDVWPLRDLVVVEETAP